MLTVRRLYILAASLIGLLLFMQGSSALLRLVFLTLFADSDFGLGSDWWRESLSLGLALVAVGTPLWIGHWIWAQRLARDRAETSSALRALYFLGVLGVTIIQTAGAANAVLSFPLERLAGVSTEIDVLLDGLAKLLIYGLIWVYHIRLRPPMQLHAGVAATITRWYWYAISFGSVGIVATSVIALLTALLNRLIGADSVSSGWWQLPVANAIAWTIVGSAGWTYHWAIIQRHTAVEQSPELQSVLRKVYLYAMVGSGAAGALLAIGRILYLALLSALGAVGERLEFVDNVTWVVPTALVAVTGWFYHRYHLQRDAALVAELPRQATIRRIYSYLLTAIGIALLSFGVFGILRLVIGILTGRADTLDLSGTFLQQQLSLYVTLLLVGLAAWVWYWRQIQQELDADGSGEERASLVRRIYLYLVSAASVIGVVVAVGTLLYQALRSVLGISSANDFIDALNIHVSVALIAVALLWYHVRFLRQEHRAPMASEEDEKSEVQETTVAAAEGATATSLVVTIAGGDLKSARASLEQSPSLEGSTVTFLESTLAPHEISQRLRSDSDEEG